MNSKKQPSKREISRKMDVYRKRLRRAESKMEKRIKSGEFKGDELKKAKEYKEKISKAIEGSYATKKGYKRSLHHYEEVTQTVSYTSRNEFYKQVDKRNEDTVQAHDQAREQIDANRKLNINKVMEDANVQVRKNLQFQREMAQARLEDGVSQLSNLDVSAFYRATQSIWEGEDLLHRNVAIMKYFNVTSLEEAYNKVLNDKKVKEYIKELKELSSDVDDTEKKMGGKDKDEEDWKYDNRIVGVISKRTFTRRNA